MSATCVPIGTDVAVPRVSIWTKVGTDDVCITYIRSLCPWGDGRVGASAHPPVPPTDKDMPRERYEEEEDGFEKFEK